MVRETLRSSVEFRKWISENQFRLCMRETFSSGLQTRRELRSEWTHTIFDTRLLTTFWTKESVFSTFKFLSDIPTLRQPQNIFRGLILERRSRLFSGELGRKKVWRTPYLLGLKARGKNFWVSKLAEILLNPKFHLEWFWDVQMLWEPLGKMLCEGLVIFKNRFGIFIDQIFGGLKSDWNFWNCCNEIFLISRPSLE